MTTTQTTGAYGVPIHTATTLDDLIAITRGVVDQHTAAQLGHAGPILDMFTASVWVQIFDGLNAKNFARLAAMGADERIDFMIRLGERMMAKSR